MQYEALTRMGIGYFMKPLFFYMKPVIFLFCFIKQGEKAPLIMPNTH